MNIRNIASNLSCVCCRLILQRPYLCSDKPNACPTTQSAEIVRTVINCWRRLVNLCEIFEINENHCELRMTLDSICWTARSMERSIFFFLKKSPLSSPPLYTLCKKWSVLGFSIVEHTFFASGLRLCEYFLILLPSSTSEIVGRRSFTKVMPMWPVFMKLKILTMKCLSEMFGPKS